MKRLHLAIFSASAAFLAAEIAVTAYLYQNLPAQIPTHFGWAGNPDAWTEKTLFWAFLIPIIQLAIYLLFVLLYRKPQYSSWPTTLILVTVEEKKRDKMYDVLRSMQSWTLLWTTLLLAYLQYIILATANGRVPGMETYFLIGMLGILLVIIIGINARMYLTVKKLIKV